MHRREPRRRAPSGRMLGWHSVPASARFGHSAQGRVDRFGEGSSVAHDERRLQVLRAIVQDFVSTNDPVGSKALAERHDLGVSPATIRNDMAVLEEQGYITQPHTSAGRGPTDKGHPLVVRPPPPGKPPSGGPPRAGG